jgi:hypothetical protein
MQLNVYISSASDGLFHLRAVELPELAARTKRIEDIPEAVSAAAAEITGGTPADFDIVMAY